ncbi:MAG: Ig-like domain-containing protein, partial [Elusimicrobiaceae bacterium]|nr:Ig-like domain-containing protein [Elusimicrobiaceae bacterium]
MRAKVLFLSFCFTVLITMQGWGADLKVLSAKPQGEQSYTNRAAVSVTFNQPVAALSENSAFATADCPLQITPAVAGTCRFSGTQTLQFEPAQDWTAATEYTVTLPGSFTSRVNDKKLGSDYRFSFITPRPQVQEVIPYDKEQWIDVRPLIFVTLNQPVHLASAQQAVRLTYPGSKARKPTWWERLKAFIFRRNLNIRPAEIAVPVRVRALTDKEFEEKFSYQK